MLLLGGNQQQDGTDTWSAHAAVRAQPGEVLQALTDPDLIAAWAPMSFELECSDGQPLHTGSCERVSGSIAGLRASFEVEVTRADAGVLELVADGPLALDACYRFREQRGRVVIDARVGLRKKGGLTAQLLRTAFAALLNAGALERALERLAASVGDGAASELAAAA
jgi:hypothetical protein